MTRIAADVRRVRFPPFTMLSLYRPIAFCLVLCYAHCFTPMARSELSRKFKYYHKDVRPDNKFNVVTSINGSYFSLNTEVLLFDTKTTADKLYVKMALVVNYFDSRLKLRDLQTRVKLTNEYQPWLPDVEFTPDISHKRVSYLDPKTGLVTTYYKLETEIKCNFDHWKYPFSTFQCVIQAENVGDEHLVVRIVKDRRTQSKSLVSLSVSERAHAVFIKLQYSNNWNLYVVIFYLPTILLFAVVVFAQWKRRKIQVFITVAAIVCLVFMQSSIRFESTVSVKDLWLCGTLIHTICVLLIDLILPSRHIKNYTFRQDPNNGSFSSLSAYAPRAFVRPVPPATVTHQVAVMSMGNKKQIALFCVLLSYAAFLLTYLAVVVCIIR
ncbi:hypothetical protein L596_018060 [Steinernema carpocapsae]|uniref:Neurotransmitter-gated ion-channel ligand-binding domain-containing protein n=2 Tax=Steinernema carpocapsae TaxID=34508 RepID=A0A4U5N3U4_STECR|nr:hypothetical protein L596_018060 [Steinernema carpocapsae]